MLYRVMQHKIRVHTPKQPEASENKKTTKSMYPIEEEEATMSESEFDEDSLAPSTTTTDLSAKEIEMAHLRARKEAKKARKEQREAEKAEIKAYKAARKAAVKAEKEAKKAAKKEAKKELEKKQTNQYDI